MKCCISEELLQRYFDEEASADEVGLVETELLHCDTCRRRLSDLRIMRLTLRRLFDAPCMSLDSDALWVHVSQRVETKPRSRFLARFTVLVVSVFSRIKASGRTWRYMGLLLCPIGPRRLVSLLCILYCVSLSGPSLRPAINEANVSALFAWSDAPKDSTLNDFIECPTLSSGSRLCASALYSFRNSGAKCMTASAQSRLIVRPRGTSLASASFERRWADNHSYKGVFRAALKRRPISRSDGLWHIAANDEGTF